MSMYNAVMLAGTVSATLLSGFVLFLGPSAYVENRLQLRMEKQAADVGKEFERVNQRLRELDDKALVLHTGLANLPRPDKPPPR